MKRFSVTSFTTLLAVACGGAISAPPERTTSTTETLSPLPPLLPREQCTNVFVSTNFGTSQVQNGVPSPEPGIASSCVETGHFSTAEPNVLLVDVDNPRIYNEPGIGPILASPGIVSQDAFRGTNSTQWTYSWFDSTTATSTADTPPPGYFVGGSANDTLTTYPQTGGQWGFDVNLNSPFDFPATTDGVRVGYADLSAQTFLSNPDDSQSNSGAAVTLHLNPNVLLIPIQAVAILGQTITPPRSDLPSQLALWDRVPTCDETGTVELFGGISTTTFPAVTGCSADFLATLQAFEAQKEVKKFTANVFDVAGVGSYG